MALAVLLYWTAAARGAGAHAFAAETIQVSSPDGAARIEVLLGDASRLSYRVMFRGKPVIEVSAIGIILDGAEISRDVELGSAESFRVDAKYPFRGVHSVAVNRFQGARIPVRDRKSGLSYSLEARAFNDGVAFRHHLPGSEASRVPDETTAFVIPAGSTVWYHDLSGHYEGVHRKRGIGEVGPGEWAAPPLTIRFPESAGYAAITEAALANYSGMALRAGGQRDFTVVLGHAHPVSRPFQLRYQDDIERPRPFPGPSSLRGAW